MDRTEMQVRIFCALAASPILSQSYLVAGSPIQTAAGPQTTVRVDLDAMLQDSAVLAEKMARAGILP